MTLDDCLDIQDFWSESLSLLLADQDSGILQPGLRIWAVKPQIKVSGGTVGEPGEVKSY